MLARDVMTTAVTTVAPATPVPEIAALLLDRHISAVPVVDADNRILGIVSEGDLMSHAQAIGEQRRSWWLSAFSEQSMLARDYVKTHGRVAQDVMTSDVVTIAPEASIAEIARTLEQHRIKRVPVVRDGKLVGIVTRGNLMQALAVADTSRAANVDDRTIREQLMAELNAQPWTNMLAKNIVVQDGVVHLWGVVETEDERRALCVAAENIPGVRAVEDHLVSNTVIKSPV